LLRQPDGSDFVMIDGLDEVASIARRQNIWH
jgi:hypothetical protein